MVTLDGWRGHVQQQGCTSRKRSQYRVDSTTSCNAESPSPNEKRHLRTGGARTGSDRIVALPPP